MNWNWQKPDWPLLYMAITGAPAATARRDLGQLVQLGALRRTGQLKGTRCCLSIAPQTG
jgi:hypothetical protein